MTKQLLFYERAVPVSPERHGDWSIEPRADYHFADRTNSVPLAAVEFPAAAMDYVIVFSGSEEAPQPVAVLGIEADENRYLDAEGRWDARYIPAFVRRYPFVFSRTKDENRLILCIDEDYEGWNQEGRGKRLFDVNGEQTEYFKRMLQFVQEYQREHSRTAAFCQKLKDLGLLGPATARFKHPSGKQGAMTGFMAVDREKLKALPGDELAELAKTGELELIYVHLQSMRNFGVVLARGSLEQAESERSLEDVGLTTEEPLH
jgi:hypothetical protein